MKVFAFVAVLFVALVLLMVRAGESSTGDRVVGTSTTPVVFEGDH